MIGKQSRKYTRVMHTLSHFLSLSRSMTHIHV